MSDTDFVATFLGPFGRFQLRSTLLIFLVKIPSAWFMACLIFTAKSPRPGEIFCEPPDEIDLSDTGLWIKAAHKKLFNVVENEKGYNFCEVDKNAAEKYLHENEALTQEHREFITCSKFEHQPEFYSLIHQYETFCDREVLVPLTQTFHLLGVLVGGIIAYYMLKVLSPRKTMLMGMISQLVFGIATGYAPNYGLHLFFRCAVAATCSLMCIGIMILSDITSGKYRVIVSCMFEQFWSVGVILLPLVTWFDSWAQVYVAITLPTLSLLIVYFWIPDSPRWHLKNGNPDEAKKILVIAAKLNKKVFEEINLDKQLNLMAHAMKNSPPEAKWISLWDGDKKHKLALLIAHLAWSSYLSLYFTYLLNVRVMGRNYLEANTAIVGVCEIIGTFIGLYLILNTTQKWFWASLMNIVTSLIAFSALLVPDSVPAFGKMVIYMFIVMLPTVTTSTSLSLFITCFSELVTRDKRKICNYSGVTCSRTLVMAAPFIGYCSIYGPLIPQMMMSLINIVTALLVAAFIQTPRTLPKAEASGSNNEDSVTGKYTNKAFVYD